MSGGASLAVRCNSCLGIWIMDYAVACQDHPIHAPGDLIEPFSCPYCGEFSDCFELKHGPRSITDAAIAFALQERRGDFTSKPSNL